MQTPTTAEFNTAIEVLKKDADRLNEQAAHSIIQMPDHAWVLIMPRASSHKPSGKSATLKPSPRN
jgi:hypothetical protein